MKDSPPLCIDLDGTLLDGDLLYESFFSALREDPKVLFLCPYWLCKGKAELKRQLANRSFIHYASLPYNRKLLDFIRAEKEAGRTLVLVTASDKKLAEGVAVHLGLFDQVFASDGVQNLKGIAKGRLLTRAFASSGYHYIGNGPDDIPVWKGAVLRSAANASPSTLRQLQEIGPVEHAFVTKRSLLDYLQTMRPHQWLKNLLIFVPLLAAHEGLDGHLLLKASVAFVAFSLTASVVYFLNDLWDLENDRQHPTKRARPLAAGLISIPKTCALFSAFIAMAILVSFALPESFRLTLAAYFVMTSLYSFWLKRKLIIDVVVLTMLYSARLVAGGMATGIVLSFWLLCFSQFFFFSLAMAKRYSELLDAQRKKRDDPRGRGYIREDLHQVAMLGSASGIVSTFVVAMYVNSDQVRILYHSPEVLLFVCPLLLYWLSRVWILAGRGHMHEDPVVFALKDKTSYCCGICTVAALIAASIL